MRSNRGDTIHDARDCFRRAERPDAPGLGRVLAIAEKVLDSRDEKDPRKHIPSVSFVARFHFFFLFFSSLLATTTDDHTCSWPRYFIGAAGRAGVAGGCAGAIAGGETTRVTPSTTSTSPGS